MSLFSTPLFTELVLPFLLIFVMIFAILQKSEILGKQKAQIDVLVSLAIALLLVAFPVPRSIIVKMIPWLAVATITLFVFFVLYGFVNQGPLDTNSKKWILPVFGILSALFVIILVIWATGIWPSINSIFKGGKFFGERFWTNFLLVAIIVGAIVAVLVGNGKSKDKKTAG